MLCLEVSIAILYDRLIVNLFFAFCLNLDALLFHLSHF